MNAPIVAIEMLFGINDVDSAILRITGDPTADPEREAIRLVALGLRRLAVTAPEDWHRFTECVRQAGVQLQAEAYLDAD